MAKSIDVSDLNIYYGNFLAVEGVNVSIEPRSITALIGPSGCGKSTFLRSLNRMHEVLPGARVEGKVVMDGQDLYTHVSNGRFKGGHITRHYGRPKDGIHAVQLEMCWSAYMDDEAEPRRWDESQGDAVRPLLRRLLETMLAWQPA